jgi:hypothetical protein
MLLFHVDRVSELDFSHRSGIKSIKEGYFYVNCGTE